MAPPRPAGPPPDPSGGLSPIERQQARLLEVYLAEVMARAEFARNRQEPAHAQAALVQQVRQLEALAHQHLELVAITAGIEAFCQRLQPTVDTLSFQQRRQLVVLLIDRVIVHDASVEIRYVIPAHPAGEQIPFCHLRSAYLAALRAPESGLSSRREWRNQSPGVEPGGTPGGRRESEASGELPDTS